MCDGDDSTLLNQRSAYVVYEIQNKLLTLRLRKRSSTCIVPVQGYTTTTSPHQPLSSQKRLHHEDSQAPTPYTSRTRTVLSSSPSSVSPFDLHGCTASILFLGPPASAAEISRLNLSSKPTPAFVRPHSATARKVIMKQHVKMQ
jgi:hypothetical protein